MLSDLNVALRAARRADRLAAGQESWDGLQESAAAARVRELGWTVWRADRRWRACSGSCEVAAPTAVRLLEKVNRYPEQTT